MPRLALLTIALPALLLSGCGVEPDQQVVDQAPAALYAKLSSALTMVQHRAEGCHGHPANTTVTIATHFDRTEGKMLHMDMSLMGASEEVTMWFEPGPTADQTLLKATIAPAAIRAKARDISKDLLKQVEWVLDSGYSTFVEDCV